MSTTAVEGQQLPPVVAPAPPTGQAAPGVSDAKDDRLTREEVDRILAGKGKEVERARAEAAQAQAEAKAKADALAKLEADHATAAKALADAEGRAKTLEEANRLRLEAVGKEADALLSTWSEHDRAALAGLGPEERLRVAQLTERRSTEMARQVIASGIPGGQPKPAPLADSGPVDYMAEATARLAARQHGAPRKK